MPLLEPLQAKNILPELLNQRFLWYESYHHYDDWKSTMTAAFDQFNLLEIPSEKKDQAKLFFKDYSMNRRIPQGVFPDAKSPRFVLRHQDTTPELAKALKADDYTKYERSPMASMVEAELERNAQCQQISVDLKVLTNLQNIKHGLKSDATDHQICDLLFAKLTFTDALIDAHLKDASSGSASFAERDAESYRKFIDA